MDFQLSSKKPAFQVPSYSLTGDIISFARCGLQYRYSVVGRLPATRPAQLWFGQFVHGVLEEGFRRYQDSRSGKASKQVSFSSKESQEIIDLVKSRLRKQGLRARSRDLELQGEYRATIALRDLAPLIFPLITEAEVRLTGTREVPVDQIKKEDKLRGVTRYEMVGVVDVITEVSLNDQKFKENLLVAMIASSLMATPTDKFEVIVDYKGMRRPVSNSKAKRDFRQLYERQIQTYSYLREVQIEGRRVAAGALIWVNELAPSWADLDQLRDEINSGKAEIVPPKDSADYKIIMDPKARKKGSEHPNLSLEFRLKRALLIVPVDHSTVEKETKEFDNFVAEIESSMGREMRTGSITGSWQANDQDKDACTACDFRVSCPKDLQGKPHLPR